MTPESRTAAFFAAWGTSFDDMTRAFEATLASGCVWDQRPLARTTGPAAAARFLRLARRGLGLATIDVDVLEIASAGDVVHTARVDHLRRADGRLIVSAPVAGVLTWDGERIVAWREYFDAATFAGRAVPNLMRRAR